MKKLFFVIPMVVSMMSFAADEIKVERRAQPLRVKSVSTETVGHGFPSTVVRVTAVFSNRCVAPTANEAVVISQYTHGFDDLVLTVASESKRMCLDVYQPVTMTYNLGTYTKPNDGFFKNIIVNGVKAD